MKQTGKRIVSVLLALVLVCGLTTAPAMAAGTYDPAAALSYAKAHWNDGKGLCAEFVRKCLRAGGRKVTANGCTTMVRQLKQSGYGTWYQLTREADGRISVPKNSGKLSPGDPVFFYCPSETDGCPYVHVVLYSSQDSRGYLRCYAHNDPMNDQVIQYARCGYCDGKVSAAYVYHMDSKKTDTTPTTPTTPATPEPQPTTLSASVSSVAMAVGESRTVTLTIGGDLPQGCRLLVDRGDDPFLVTNDWGGYTSGRTIHAVLTGARGGQTTVTYTLTDGTSALVAQTVWVTVTAPTYTIRYDANGGTGAPAPQVLQDRGVILSETRPTREGHEFVGWATSRTGPMVYWPGAVYEDGKDVTLYAVWRTVEPTYTVRYDANGGTGAPAAQTVTGKGLILSETVPTWEGHEFQGWATSKTGPVVYRPGWVYEDGVDVTLYAVWTAQEKEIFTVRYDANGGTNAPAAQTAEIGKRIYMTSEEPVREGYTFLGWSTSRGSGGSTSSGGFQFGAGVLAKGTGFTGDTTLYAVWKEDVPTGTLTLERSTFDVAVGEEFTLVFTAKGDVARRTYEVADESICTFLRTDVRTDESIGMIFQAKAAGTTTVTIAILDGSGRTLAEKTATVTVRA